MSAVLAWISSRVLGLGVFNLVLTIGGVAIVSAIIWLWSDYQNAKAANIRWEREYEIAHQVFQHEITVKDKLLAQKEIDLQTARDLSTQRAIKVGELRERLGEVVLQERPDADKNCPIHPAINYAIERLRPGKKPAYNRKGN